jgi:hypothetical protein
MRHTLKRAFLILLVFGAVYLMFLAVLFEYRAREELNEARTFREQGNVEVSNRHYFQALNWYAPWGSSQTAADELMSIAEESFKHGQKTESFMALLRLRSGLLAARSFYVPRRDLIEKANKLIVLYLAESKLGPGATQQEIMTQANVYEQLYALDKLHKQSWYFFVLLGFFLWVCASFWLIIIFFGSKRSILFKVRLKLARIPLAIFVYGYALWIFSMSVA